MSTGFGDDVSQPSVLPALWPLGQGAILQYDICLHRTCVVNKFLQQQQDDQMNWLACSFDLSPIEHLWDILGDEHESTILEQMTLGLTTCSTFCSKRGRQYPRTCITRTASFACHRYLELLTSGVVAGMADMVIDLKCL